MININEALKKAHEKREDTSIVFAAAQSEQPVVKVTIEIPGQDSVVLEDLNDFMVFSRSKDKTGCIGMAGPAFLIWIFQEIKQKINESLKLSLQEIIKRG